jgi:competence ComEA-like helix-hairpin-helix protein
MESPIQEPDVSNPGQWSLRPRELGLWIALTLVVGVWPALGRVRSVAASDVQIQSVSKNNDGRIDVLKSGSTWRLDINSATLSELEMLPGVGATRARAILQERHRRGAFQSIWDLSEVPGITRGLVQRLEPLLRVQPRTDPAPPSPMAGER